MSDAAWSYSSLTSVETCPRQHYETRIKKNFRSEQGPELLWGNQVHKACENYVVNHTPLPKGMEQYQGMLDRIKNAPGTTFGEREIALTKDFKQTEWWGKDVWVRLKIDVLKINGRVSFLGDYKTGNYKPECDQLKLFAAGIFHVEPSVDVANTTFIWLKDRKLTPETYKREDLLHLWNQFLPRVNRYQQHFESGKWEPKPSGLCRKHCPVTTCEYNGRS